MLHKIYLNILNLLKKKGIKIKEKALASKSNLFMAVLR
jgi:hypothetical protein